MLEVWFSYVFISTILFGFTTIVDKLMLEKRLSSFSYYVSFVPPALAFSIGVLLSVPTNLLSAPCLIALLAGLISAAGYFVYVVSIRREEASRIAALTSLAPAFVAALALLFINEIFPATSYIGIVLMILGSALISYKRKHVRKIIPTSLILILILTNFMYSVDQTLSKISLNQLSFWSFLAMFMLGRFAPAFPGLAVPSLRKRSVLEIKRLGRKLTLILATGSIIWSLAIVLFFYSASLGPITLVSTTQLIAPLFTLLFAIMITKYFPRSLEEEIDRRTIALKLVAILLVILGTYLIMT